MSKWAISIAKEMYPVVAIANLRLVMGVLVGREASPHQSSSTTICAYALRSLFFSSMSLAGVLAYLYPAQMTTQELRAGYDAVFLQEILKYSMWLALFLGVITFVIDRQKRNGFIGIVITAIAFALGGYNRPLA